MVLVWLLKKCRETPLVRSLLSPSSFFSISNEKKLIVSILSFKDNEKGLGGIVICDLWKVINWLVTHGGVVSLWQFLIVHVHARKDISKWQSKLNGVMPTKMQLDYSHSDYTVSFTWFFIFFFYFHVAAMHHHSPMSLAF